MIEDILAFSTLSRKFGKPGSAIRSGDWKLVFHYESNNAELFNLKEDPKESNDLSYYYLREKQIFIKKIEQTKK